MSGYGLWRRRVRSLVTVGLLATSLQLVAAKPSQAVDGTILRTITAQNYSCGLGTGLAFDGTDLLLSCWGQNLITAISPGDGSFRRSYTISGVSDLGALAYDVGRASLWACDARSQIVLIDLATQTSSTLFSSDGCIDGLAFDGTDDTIYTSGDAASTYQHYTSAGLFLSSTSISGKIGACGNSGLAIGGPFLFLANDGCSQIYQAPKDGLTDPVLFGSYGARLEDMECGDLTFQGTGKAAIWSKDAYDGVLNAFELNPGDCGFGGRPPAGTALAVADPIVNNMDPTLLNTAGGGTEPSIAINPTSPNEVVISSGTAAQDRWGAGVPNAPLLISEDGGKTWEKKFAVPAPPQRFLAGCPCDSTIAFSQSGTLYLTVLSVAGDGLIGKKGGQDIYTASNSGDPGTPGDWVWRKKNLIAQATNTTKYKSQADQPWLVTGPSPTQLGIDNVYVGYTFTKNPQVRVATSFLDSSPPDFTKDSYVGGASNAATNNPGLRLTADPNNGYLYAVWATSQAASSTADVLNVTHHLNRSTDGGRSWALNGAAGGINVATTPSYQGAAAVFGGVNQLRGSVLSAAVDPVTSEVVVAYGADGVSGAGNHIMTRRFSFNGSGDVTGQPSSLVSGPTAASALPSIAFLKDGTAGVLYTVADDVATIDNAVITTFSVHLGIGAPGASSFTDVKVSSFQITHGTGTRVLGDYQQLRSIGDTFFGSFAASRGTFSASTTLGNTVDPAFFRYQPCAATSSCAG